MTVEREALAALADDVARALTQYAHALRAGEEEENEKQDAAVGAPRGKRQQTALHLAGIDTAVGLTAGEVATGVQVRQPNAYKLLTTQVAGGWLEVVPGVEPPHWWDTTESNTLTQVAR